MEINVIKNLSPILALKTYYMINVKNITKQENIPFLKIHQSLTQTQPGFNNQYEVEWDILLKDIGYLSSIKKIPPLIDEALILVKYKNLYYAYLVFKTKKIKKNITESEALKEFKIDFEIEYFYPEFIFYDSYTNEFNINLFSINILTCEALWLDFQTLSDDNKHILEIIKAKNMKWGVSNLSDNPILKIILKSVNTIVPKYLSFIMHNRIAGPQIMFREINNN